MSIQSVLTKKMISEIRSELETERLTRNELRHESLNNIRHFNNENDDEEV